MKRLFTWIYRTNAWAGWQSRSGRGSSMDETAAVRECFPDLVRRYNIRSILDIPCGDFAWMKHTSLELDHYIGADIVSAIVSNNLAQYKSEHHPVRDFQLLDITRDVLPCADAVLCRDCLVHFSIDSRVGLEALKQLTFWLGKVNVSRHLWTIASKRTLSCV